MKDYGYDISFGALDSYAPVSSPVIASVGGNGNGLVADNNLLSATTPMSGTRYGSYIPSRPNVTRASVSLSGDMDVNDSTFQAAIDAEQGVMTRRAYKALNVLKLSDKAALAR